MISYAISPRLAPLEGDVGRARDGRRHCKVKFKK